MIDRNSRWEGILSELLSLRQRESRLSGRCARQRLEIAERRRELREAARALAGSDWNHALATRLEAVENEIVRAIGNRIPGSFAGAGTGMGGGIDPDVLHNLNRRVDKASDLKRLSEEAAELRRLRALASSDGK